MRFACVVAVAAVALSVPLSEARKCAPVTAVAPFDLPEYLGVWYQIADNKAFNNQFEAGTDCVYANYSLENPTTVRVENQGFYPNGTESKAVGKAKQVVPGTGELKVSFFGPFYGPYNVINLKNDTAGKYAISLVYSCSEFLGEETVEDLWVLSRTRAISDQDYDAMLKFATQHGIDVARLQMEKTKQTGCPQ